MGNSASDNKQKSNNIPAQRKDLQPYKTTTNEIGSRRLDYSNVYSRTNSGRSSTFPNIYEKKNEVHSEKQVFLKSQIFQQNKVAQCEYPAEVSHTKHKHSISRCEPSTVTVSSFKSGQVNKTNEFNIDSFPNQNTVRGEKSITSAHTSAVQQSKLPANIQFNIPIPERSDTRSDFVQEKSEPKLYSSSEKEVEQNNIYPENNLNRKTLIPKSAILVPTSYDPLYSEQNSVDDHKVHQQFNEFGDKQNKHGISSTPLKQENYAVLIPKQSFSISKHFVKEEHPGSLGFQNAVLENYEIPQEVPIENSKGSNINLTSKRKQRDTHHKQQGRESSEFKGKGEGNNRKQSHNQRGRGFGKVYKKGRENTFENMRHNMQECVSISDIDSSLSQSTESLLSSKSTDYKFSRGRNTSFHYNQRGRGYGYTKKRGRAKMHENLKQNLSENVQESVVTSSHKSLQQSFESLTSNESSEHKFKQEKNNRSICYNQRGRGSGKANSKQNIQKAQEYGLVYNLNQDFSQSFESLSSCTSSEYLFRQNEDIVSHTRKQCDNPSGVNIPIMHKHKIVGKAHNSENQSVLMEKDRCFDYTKNVKDQSYCEDVKISNKQFMPRFRYLQGLCQKEPVELIQILVNSNINFDELLRTSLKPDWIILIVKLISVVCCCDFHENKTKILLVVCQDHFLKQLSLLISNLAVEKDKERISMLPEFIENLITFYQSVTDLLPNVAHDSILELVMKTDLAVSGMEKFLKIEFHSSVRDDLKCLHDKLQFIGSKFVSEKGNRRNPKYGIKDLIFEQTAHPPDNFRDVQIIPSGDEILKVAQGFIRPNIVTGQYENTDHYLDVQFRLLREDFLIPLRQGISEYLYSAKSNKSRFGNVRIYRKVKFIGPKVVGNNLGYLINFDPEHKFKKVNWENSKRFLFGSLLCFTSDNFKSVIFATVLDREMKMLKNCQILIQFCSNVPVPADVFKQDFIMAECEIYFDPYFCVLKALQRITENTFPMSPYILGYERNRHFPKYVLQNDNYNSYIVKNWEVNLINRRSWPTNSQLSLDDSQYKAFWNAITSEFVVIQGPPGTGKTFIGIKIAEALLQNKSKWSNERQPMLVVCYTNHALDQFLEGLLQFTNNMIRVGGQSKSEIMTKLNIKEKRKAYRRAGFENSCLKDVRQQMVRTLNHTSTKQKYLDSIVNKKGIISIKLLESVMTSHHLHYFCKSDIDPDEILIKWLLFEIEEEIFDSTNKDLECDTPPVEELSDDDFDIEEIEEEEAKRFKIIDDNDFLLTLNNEADHLIINFETFIEDVNEKRIYLDQLEGHNLERVVEYWKGCLAAPLNSDLVHSLENEHIPNLENLPVFLRWQLYKHWVHEWEQILMSELHEFQRTLSEEMLRYEEMLQMQDLKILRDAEVIGMTTTGAARYHYLLMELKPTIVFVEEAAEVLESHIVTSLSGGCEHLILIGDHLQLRPSSAVYRLQREYNLDVSLFERMVRNGMHMDTLTVQHRMRPEIANLITPAIYPVLHNHDSVLKFEKVHGVEKNLFFLTHMEPEDQVEDVRSRINKHEAEFLISFCRYLLLQEYKPSDITILTTYSAQVMHLRSLRKKLPMLRDVKITSVDNFQGEENKLILLSLVRSNGKGDIGFLKVENRVCVALSRAKEGLFIIGNMDNLSSGSTIWKKINSTLEVQHSFGHKLTLVCQIHQTKTQVSTANDFKNVPEGGCLLPCALQLKCGHVCKSVCHSNDRDHKMYRCREPCNRTSDCVFGHLCTKRCYENCGKCVEKVEKILPCRHTAEIPCHLDPVEYKCTIKVSAVITICGHTVTKPCYLDFSEFPCPEPCEIRLPCGHRCTKTCHAGSDPDHLEFICYKDCRKNNKGCTQDHHCKKRCHEICDPCAVMVKKKLVNCTHYDMMKCSDDPRKIICKQYCKRQLPCGHNCKMKCSEPCGNCKVKVKKVLPICGHEVTVVCSEEPLPQMCSAPCARQLPCGHICQRKCSEPCEEICRRNVKSPIALPCGHMSLVPCCLVNDGIILDEDETLKHCSEACGFKLECGHTCQGTCSACFQGRLHVSCKEKCGRVLICGHECDTPCSETCPPCNKRCNYRCKHSVCPRKCGEPCVPCQEPCLSKCIHSKCKKVCHELCDRKPCEHPCDEQLPCGHSCIGFCGEPCPPLCRVCDCKEVTEIKYGYEDEDDARFVYLDGCKHTIESRGLESWLTSSSSEVVMKGCPDCKTPITDHRYINMIKMSYQDISLVKQRVYGKEEEIAVVRISQLERLDYLKKKIAKLPGALCNCLINHSEILIGELQIVKHNRRNNLSLLDTQALCTKIDILEEIINILMSNKEKFDDNAVKKLTEHVSWLFSISIRPEVRVTLQRIQDVELEVLRLKGLVELCAIESNLKYQRNCRARNIQQNYNYASKILKSFKKFSIEQDAFVKSCLLKLGKELEKDFRLTEYERKEIRKAMGYQKGHWYKCPNGHLYVITECGRAMVISRCPECGESIGGAHHTLLSTNIQATEMDQ